MPILTCPTCGSKLEVADEDLGHTVQCGSCQQTFAAEDPTAKKNDGASKKPYAFKDKDKDKDDDDDGDDDRPSRRRGSRRDRDDEDDDDRDSGYRPRRSRRRDGDDDYEGRYGPPQQTGMGIASLILGIISIPTIACYGIGIPCAILAIVFGILSLKTEGRGMGIAGIITAAVSFLLLIAIIVFYVVVLTAAGAGGGPGGGGGGGRF